MAASNNWQANVWGNSRVQETIAKKYTALKICTFNIQHGAGARLEQAARCLSTMGIILYVDSQWIN
jgi:hypothetical protein